MTATTEIIGNYASRSKIEKFEVITLRAGVPEDLEFPTASFVEEGFCIVKLFTGDGIIGLGEPSPYMDNLSLVDLFEKELIEIYRGKPLNEAWNTLGRSDRDGSVIKSAALAGLSQALLDAIGKEQDKPCWRLMASPDLETETSVKVYASGGMLSDGQPLELLLDEVLMFQEKGFNAWKFRPPIPAHLNHAERTKHPPAVDLEAMLSISRKIRNAVGDDFDLMLDLGCRIPFIKEAKYLCDGLAELNFFMVEEPLPREAGEYVALRNQTEVRISGGETLDSATQIQQWMRLGSLDIVQPDANFLGLYDGMIVGQEALEKNYTVVPHNWANAIANAANVHFATALGKKVAPLMEYSQVFNPLRESFVEDPLIPIEGTINVGHKPGLGLSLNEDVVDAYRI